MEEESGCVCTVLAEEERVGVQYKRKKREWLWVCTVLAAEGGFLVLAAANKEGVAVYILMWVCTVLAEVGVYRRSGSGCVQ